MKIFLLKLAKAAGFVLLAAVLVWFSPVLLFQNNSTDPRFTAAFQKKRRQHKEAKFRKALEKWIRKENQTRSKKAWKNRNNFYK